MNSLTSAVAQAKVLIVMMKPPNPMLAEALCTRAMQQWLTDPGGVGTVAHEHF
jgi:hypothetical protein